VDMMGTRVSGARPRMVAIFLNFNTIKVYKIV
jgi:hypothetical protein